MASRKTISVVDVITMVNNYNMNSGDDKGGERDGHNGLLATILHKTGNYNGFGYVHKGGSMATYQEVNSGQYDETRRHYYYPSTRMFNAAARY